MSSFGFDGQPHLIKDPDTGLYGIMVDCVEVISGLDPIGLRQKVYEEARQQGLPETPSPSGREEKET